MHYNSLKYYAEQLENQNAVKYATLYEEISQKEKAEIVVVGEFSNGKSTLLNAIIGKDILPTGIGATTSIITYLQKGDENKIGCKDREVYFDDSNAKTIINDFFNQCNEKKIEIYLKEFVFNDFLIVDTPGINDINKDRELITCEYAPKADAMIFVLDVSKGFSRFEKEFFEGLSDTSKDKIFVVFNKIDSVDNFSAENVSYHLKAGNIDNVKGFGVSAKLGVRGVLSNSKEIIAESGIDNFKSSLIDYVNGRISRQTVQNRKKRLIERSYSLCVTQLDSQLNGFKMNAHQLEETIIKYNTKLELAKIERDKKLNEFEHSYKSIKSELESLVNKYKEDFIGNYLSIRGISKKIDYIKSDAAQNLTSQFIKNIQVLLKGKFEGELLDYIPKTPIFLEYIQQILDSMNQVLFLLDIKEITKLLRNSEIARYIGPAVDFIKKGAAFLRGFFESQITEKILDNKVSSMFDNIDNSIISQFKKIEEAAKMELNLEVEKIGASVFGLEKAKNEKTKESEEMINKIEAVNNFKSLLTMTYESELSIISK